MEYLAELFSNRSNSSNQKSDLKSDYFYNVINPLKKEIKPDRKIK